MFLSFGFLNAQSQYARGYIINAQGAKIKGLILDQSFWNLSRSVSFKRYAGSEVTVFKPDQIKGFMMNEDQLFRSEETKVYVPGYGEEVMRRFFRVLVDGKASLYAMDFHEGVAPFFVGRDTGGVREMRQISGATHSTVASLGALDTVIIERTADETHFHLVSQMYRLTLDSMMRDCGESASLATRAVLSQMSLKRLVKGYNACVGLGSKVYFGNQFYMYLGAMGGARMYGTGEPALNQSYIRLDKTTDAVKSRMTGLYLGFGNPVFSKNLSFELGLAKWDYQVGGSGYRYNLAFPATYATAVERNELLQMTFRVNYDLFPSSWISPFLTAGFEQINNRDRLTVDNEEVKFYPQTVDQRDNTDFNVLTGVGVNVRVLGRHVFRGQYVFWSAPSFQVGYSYRFGL